MSSRPSPAIGLHGLLLVVLASALLALEPSCLDRWDNEQQAPSEGRCATCHGNPARAGDFAALRTAARSFWGG